MIIQQDMDLMKKLTILSDAAKYDAACTCLLYTSDAADE